MVKYVTLARALLPPPPGDHDKLVRSGNGMIQVCSVQIKNTKCLKRRENLGNFYVL